MWLVDILCEEVDRDICVCTTLTSKAKKCSSTI